MPLRSLGPSTLTWCTATHRSHVIVVDHECQLAGEAVKEQWDLFGRRGQGCVRRAIGGEPRRAIRTDAAFGRRSCRGENLWRSGHFLVRAEFCAFINEGRFGWQRKWRAKTALKAAPKESPYRRD
jgi:hypothetical protein